MTEVQQAQMRITKRMDYEKLVGKNKKDDEHVDMVLKNFNILNEMDFNIIFNSTHFSKMATIKDFEKYLIFENGAVFSKKRNIILKPHLNNKSTCVVLYKNGKRFIRSVQKLISTTFIENPESIPDEEDDDGEYPADHPSWDNKFCSFCKSPKTKGKWIGCESCDTIWRGIDESDDDDDDENL